jgi:3-hydroxyisobutyrate dehydrogenase
MTVDDVEGARENSIGVVGLGDMGRPIARSLLRSGFRVLVHDLRAQSVADLVADGAMACPDLGAMREQCEVVSLVVTDEAAARSVLAPSSGLRDASRGDLLLLVHTTMSPLAMRALVTEVRPSGVRLIDAPVSGASIRAEAGDLTVLLGGSEEDIARVGSVLAAISSHAERMGDVGAGSVAKLVNNILVIGTKMCAYEAMRLAQAYGLDEEAVLAVVAQSTGDSWVVRHWKHGDDLLVGHTLAGTPAYYEYVSKDLWAAASAARAAGVHLPAVAMLSELLPVTYRQRADLVAERRADHVE